MRMSARGQERRRRQQQGAEARESEQVIVIERRACEDSQECAHRLEHHREQGRVRRQQQGAVASSSGPSLCTRGLGTRLQGADARKSERVRVTERIAKSVHTGLNVTESKRELEDKDIQFAAQQCC